MKTIEVVAAIIILNNKVFVTQRGYGELKDGWEFPGGKIETGEQPKQALKREIKEELDTNIEVGKEIYVVEYDYPAFHLSMHCYECSIVSGNLQLKEHKDSKWLCEDELESVNWLPADIALIPIVKEILVKRKGFYRKTEEK